jgi:uncharacterized protein (TIGR00730 family)
MARDPVYFPQAPKNGSPNLTDSDGYNRWGKGRTQTDDKSVVKGPQRRLEDIRLVSQISYEFIRGFRAFHEVGPCTTFFGSARFGETHEYYQLARFTARLIAKHGYTVMTGGGPGIMEAANRGAKDVNGKSVGCNISLPHEQTHNRYLDMFVELNYFFVRKVMLLRYSLAFVVLPGGFGTLDEVFETITLIQTKKIDNFPIVMMGKKFWAPMKAFIYENLLAHKTISENDLKLLYFTDSPEEALEIVKACVEKQADKVPREALEEDSLLQDTP